MSKSTIKWWREADIKAAKQLSFGAVSSHNGKLHRAIYSHVASFTQIIPHLLTEESKRTDKGLRSQLQYCTHSTAMRFLTVGGKVGETRWKCPEGNRRSREAVVVGIGREEAARGKASGDKHEWGGRVRSNYLSPIPMRNGGQIMWLYHCQSMTHVPGLHKRLGEISKVIQIWTPLWGITSLPC